MKTQYKIKDILTKEYIRVLIPLIIENYKCEIDPKTLRSCLSYFFCYPSDVTDN